MAGVLVTWVYLPDRSNDLPLIRPPPSPPPLPLFGLLQHMPMRHPGHHHKSPCLPDLDQYLRRGGGGGRWVAVSPPKTGALPSLPPHARSDERRRDNATQVCDCAFNRTTMTRPSVETTNDDETLPPRTTVCLNRTAAGDERTQTVSLYVSLSVYLRLPLSLRMRFVLFFWLTYYFILCSSFSVSLSVCYTPHFKPTTKHSLPSTPPCVCVCLCARAQIT